MISYAHANHQFMANWDSYAWLIFIVGGALIVMMLYRPAGIWPSRVRRRELGADEKVETA